MKLDLATRLTRLHFGCRFGAALVQTRPAVASIEVLENRIAPAAAFSQFVDPHPVPGSSFGSAVVALKTGNVVITAPHDEAGGVDAGAVYLFNGQTGALISTLTGSHPDDEVGNFGVIALSNGNFVVKSPTWSNGTATFAGAVTWGSGTTGVSGVVSGANSLIGSSAGDQVGGFGAEGVTALSNGNYVVSSAAWTNGTVHYAGAVTWGSGTAGVSGAISAANSLVGSTASDEVGSDGKGTGITALSNGNYVVNSPGWHSGVPGGGGAVTWGSGTAGVTGPVSAANSLVSTAGGRMGAGVTALSNGNYVVSNPGWANGAADRAGAVTWGSGTAGVSGPISAANSLVGSTADDFVGQGGVTALSNGNYVVGSPSWHNGSVVNAGAVTWGNGTTGVSGPVSAANSLVGSTGSAVGLGGVTALSNGNYVVSSPGWSNGAINGVGAVTWGSGTAGISGAVSTANSLVGSTNSDQVGSGGVTALTNGNYVVSSQYWNNGTAASAGAATWENGATGVSGTVSAANSLVGSSQYDFVGSHGEGTGTGNRIGVTALSNGNYVISSPDWSNGPAKVAGAVTWGSGTAGVSGAVSAANSLVGGTAGDAVGDDGVMALNNGNYVASSQNWSNGKAAGAGAVTWGNGTTGVSGAVSALNSLVGSTAGDHVGEYNNVLGGAVTALSNGNYVVDSYSWSNGKTKSAGAATWGSGTTGVSGVVSAANSLVGSLTGDSVGSGGVTALSSGNYVVNSPSFHYFGAADPRTVTTAVTFGSGASGVKGAVASANSVIGLNAGVDDLNQTFFAQFQGEGDTVIVGSQVDGLPNLAYVDGAGSFSQTINGVTVTVSGGGGMIVVTPGNLPNEIASIDLTPVSKTITLSVKSAATGPVTVDKIMSNDATATRSITLGANVMLGDGRADITPDLVINGKLTTLTTADIAPHTMIQLGLGLSETDAGKNKPNLKIHDVMGDGVTIDATGNGMTGGGGLGKVAINSWAGAGTLKIAKSIASFTIAHGDFDSLLQVGRPAAAGMSVPALAVGHAVAAAIDVGNVGSISIPNGQWAGTGLEVEGVVAKFLTAGLVNGTTIEAGAFGTISIKGNYAGKILASLDPTVGTVVRGKTVVTATGNIGSVTIVGDFTGGLMAEGKLGNVTLSGSARFEGNVHGATVGNISAATLIGTGVAGGPRKAISSSGSIGKITAKTGGFTDYVLTAASIGSITIKGGGLGSDLTAASFGAVSVTGGGFSGSLTSSTAPATLGKTKALTSFSITGGNLSGDITLAGTSGAITVKGGSISAALTAASFGAVSVTGGDFAGSLTSLTPGATLGKIKALTSLTVSDGNLTGDIRLLGASGAITVKAKPALAAGSITGASIVASAIASLTVAHDVTGSIILAGADLGADHALGGGNDTFAAGTIGAVKIGGNVSGAGSLIGAGFSTTDAILKDTDDAIIGGMASTIASLTITGTAAPESFFAAGLFKAAPKIASHVVPPATDGRFKVA